MVATEHTQILQRASERMEDFGRDARYAIYFAPHRDSAWWQFGCAWLGRDPITDTSVPRELPPTLKAAGFDADYLTRITAAPRLYGFHATLKAPFRLRAGYTSRDVYRQADNLTQSLIPTILPPVQLGSIDGFVALSFARAGNATDGPSTSPVANALAAQCVSAFDHLRAEPTAQELARRHAVKLTPRQANLLAEWGYPYVFQEFRFHMTLTNPLPLVEQQNVIAALLPAVTQLNERPMLLDALAVCYQPAPDAPFVVTRRYGFDGQVEIYRDET